MVLPLGPPGRSALAFLAPAGRRPGGDRQRFFRLPGDLRADGDPRAEANGFLLRRRLPSRDAARAPWGLLIYEVVREYGWSWFKDPDWPTSDHCVPYHEFLLARRALIGIYARDQLNIATGITVAVLSDEHGGDQLRATIKDQAGGVDGTQRR